mmetsp:Transcript_7389/g.17756  ORF Transcript_7389/g.17756 Transcript_7389/m.17756 type:complete len:283 (+) Transcript_7389:543-1391(+)
MHRPPARLARRHSRASATFGCIGIQTSWARLPRALGLESLCSQPTAGSLTLQPEADRHRRRTGRTGLGTCTCLRCAGMGTAHAAGTRTALPGQEGSHGPGMASAGQPAAAGCRRVEHFQGSRWRGPRGWRARRRPAEAAARHTLAALGPSCSGSPPARSCRGAARTAPAARARPGWRALAAPWPRPDRGMPGRGCRAPARAAAAERTGRRLVARSGAWTHWQRARPAAGLMSARRASPHGSGCSSEPTEGCIRIPQGRRRSATAVPLGGERRCPVPSRAPRG